MDKKCLCVIALLALATLAHAVQAATHKQEQHVRIWFNLDSPYTNGDVVPVSELEFVLFLDYPCDLAIVGAERMRRAWQKIARDG